LLEPEHDASSGRLAATWRARSEELDGLEELLGTLILSQHLGSCLRGKSFLRRQTIKHSYHPLGQ
jgi:hypothetical protein